jgi:hypothetical protein
MMASAFQHRSARVISVSRFAFAAAFLTIVWADPSQPAPSAYSVTYLVLTVYALWSALLVAVTWNNWWADFWLRMPAHVVDLATFGASAFLTEGLTSPFFTFFVFLVLAALQRFGGRAAALTAVIAIILYTLGGAASVLLGITEAEWDKFILRRFYLILLSLLLVWFGANNRGISRWHGRSDQARVDVLLEGANFSAERLLREVAQQVGAGTAAFFWTAREEPWVYLSILRGETFSEQRHGPDTFTSIVHEDLEGQTFIFDAAKRRAVSVVEKERLRCTSGIDPLHPTLANSLGCESGLCLSIDASEHAGTLILCGLPGLCLDELQRGPEISRRIHEVLDRASITSINASATANRIRLALARDVPRQCPTTARRRRLSTGGVAPRYSGPGGPGGDRGVAGGIRRRAGRPARVHRGPQGPCVA